MARSLAITAYRAITARAPAPVFVPDRARPDGALIWAHATNDDRAVALCDLMDRLKQQRPDCHTLLTWGTASPTGQAAPRLPDLILPDIAHPLPDDHPATAARFIDHWQPDLGIWTGGGFAANTLLAARAAQVPLLLADADEAEMERRAALWVPDLTRHCATTFDYAITSSPGATDRLMRLGVPRERIRDAAPLRYGGQPLSCDEAELDEMNGFLRGRPLWLAAYATREELPELIHAQKTAARTAHRLLMVLRPAPGCAAAEAEADLIAAGLRTERRSAVRFPADATQVLIADEAQEMGLWYRLAPMSFMAGSLLPGSGGRDPFEAASLGSAVIYGPHVRDHMARYARLSASGAARMVRDAESLGVALGRLCSPDQAAAMAHAGWEVISEGADTMDRTLALAIEMLDRHEAAT